MDSDKIKKEYEDIMLPLVNRYNDMLRPIFKADLWSIDCFESSGLRRKGLLIIDLNFPCKSRNKKFRSHGYAKIFASFTADDLLYGGCKSCVDTPNNNFIREMIFYSSYFDPAWIHTKIENAMWYATDRYISIAKRMIDCGYRIVYGYYPYAVDNRLRKVYCTGGMPFFTKDDKSFIHFRVKHAHEVQASTLLRIDREIYPSGEDFQIYNYVHGFGDANRPLEKNEILNKIIEDPTKEYSSKW